MVKPKQRLTAREWFDIAERSEIASHVLLENRPETAFGVLGQPHVILRSFGVEAYLKCLIELDGRKPPERHNFWVLFKLLSPRDRRSLRERWREQYGPKMRAWNKQKNMPIKRVPVGLDGVLKLCGDAFLVIRYLPQEGIMPFLLMNFPLAIRKYILEIEPTFKPLANIFDPKPKFIKAENDQLGAIGSCGTIFNRQAAPFYFVRTFAAATDGGADPEDRGTD